MPMRKQLWLGLGLAAIVSGLLLLALARVTVPPHTDRAAVMALLDQRGIAYRDIDVHAGAGGVPQDGNAYVAAVEVAGERPAYGTIVCQAHLDDCVVWINSLGVRQQTLPQVTPDEPWVEQLRRELRDAGRRLRSWLEQPAKQGGR